LGASVPAFDASGVCASKAPPIKTVKANRIIY
jgi:hypothetical protein